MAVQAALRPEGPPARGRDQKWRTGPRSGQNPGMYLEPPVLLITGSPLLSAQHFLQSYNKFRTRPDVQLFQIELTPFDGW